MKSYKPKYPIKPLEAQEAFDQLTDWFLGEGYYIPDPVNGNQANAIIVDDIKKRYESYDYRQERLHNKAIIAKYVGLVLIGLLLGLAIGGIVFFRSL